MSVRAGTTQTIVPPPRDSRCAFLIHSFMSLPYGGFKKIAPPSASLDQFITKASRLEMSGWSGPNHLSHKVEFSNAAASRTNPNSSCNLAYRSLGVVHLSLLDVSAAAPATKKLLTGSILGMVTSRWSCALLRLRVPGTDCPHPRGR